MADIRPPPADALVAVAEESLPPQETERRPVQGRGERTEGPPAIAVLHGQAKSRGQTAGRAGLHGGSFESHVPQLPLKNAWAYVFLFLYIYVFVRPNNVLGHASFAEVPAAPGHHKTTVATV